MRNLNPREEGRAHVCFGRDGERRGDGQCSGCDVGRRDTNRIEDHELVVPSMRLLDVGLIALVVCLVKDRETARQGDRGERRDDGDDLVGAGQGCHPMIVATSGAAVNWRGRTTAD